MIHYEERAFMNEEMARDIDDPLQDAEREIARLREQLTEAREIIRPFANIEPSSLYPDDGSENEPYCVILKQDNVRNPAEFTGAHLALARAFLTKGETDA